MSECDRYRELRIEMELDLRGDLDGVPPGDAPSAECAAEVVRDLLVIGAGLRLSAVEPPHEAVEEARKRFLARLAEGGSGLAVLLAIISGIMLALAAATAAGESRRIGPEPFLAAGMTAVAGAGALGQAPRGRILHLTPRATPVIMGACASA
jgi:hypothetical protein